MSGGLNDATRNKEGIGAFEINNFTFGPIGGATNINMRASQYAAGSKLSLSGCNRNYILRGMYTYSTGLLKNGWAFTGSLGYRWANEVLLKVHSIMRSLIFWQQRKSLMTNIACL